MSASYPSTIFTFTTINNGDTSDASQIDNPVAEIIAVETGLINGVQHNLSPLTDNTKTLGDVSHGWKNAYLSAGGQIFSGGTNPFTGWTVISPTDTGALNDYAPGLSGHTLIRMNNATLATISGFASGYSGQRIRIISVGAGQVDLVHQLTSTAANRLINIATSANTSLAAGSGIADYVYDGSTSRWRLVQHEQGAWITPTFAAGDYTAATGNWTLQSGDVTTCKYLLKGRTLTFALYLVTTTVSATPAYLLRILPGGFTVATASEVIGFHGYKQGAGAFTPGGFAYVNAAADTTVRFYTNDFSTSWSTQTDLTQLFGTFSVEVQ